ncbi:hypothetical protein HGRIS_003319, partial [Hohenbuehelia grisea]
TRHSDPQEHDDVKEEEGYGVEPWDQAKQSLASKGRSLHDGDGAGAEAQEEGEEGDEEEDEVQ